MCACPPAAHPAWCAAPGRGERLQAAWRPAHPAWLAAVTQQAAARPTPQNGTTVIRLCSQMNDLAGAARADGCYEGMEVEAEPAIFRAKTSTLPVGSSASQCASSSERGHMAQ